MAVLPYDTNTGRRGSDLAACLLIGGGSSLLTRRAVREPLHYVKGPGMLHGDLASGILSGLLMEVRRQSCIKDLLFLEGCFLVRPYLLEKHCNEVTKLSKSCEELVLLNFLNDLNSCSGLLEYAISCRSCKVEFISFCCQFPAL